MKFKVERIVLLREFLVTQMNHWFLFPVYVALTVIFKVSDKISAPLPLLWLLLGALPFLFYLARRYLKKAWQTVCIHIAMIPLMLFLPAGHLILTILYLLFAAGYIGYSFYLLLKTKDRQDAKFYPVPGVILFVFILYLLHNQGYLQWDRFFIMALIVLLGIYFVIYYIEQYLDFLTANNSSAGHMPMGEMFRSGMGLVLAYTAVSVIILFCMSHTSWLKYFLNLLKQGMLYIVSLIFGLPYQENVTKRILPEQELPEMYEGTGLSATETIITVLIGILLFILAVKVLLTVIRLIQSRLKERFPVHKKSGEDVEDVREECDIVKKKRAPQFSSLSKDPDLRVRYLYKKRILTSIKEFSKKGRNERLERCTARETGRILDRKELSPLYEKARYSAGGCDKEDVKQMRRVCK